MNIKYFILIYVIREKVYRSLHISRVLVRVAQHAKPVFPEHAEDLIKHTLHIR